MKRNIGHLCHDEPREPNRRSKSEHETSVKEEDTAIKEEAGVPGGANVADETVAERPLLQDLNTGLQPSAAALDDPSQLLQRPGGANAQNRRIDTQNQKGRVYNDAQMDLHC